jgi:WD40 repeat protein
MIQRVKNVISQNTNTTQAKYIKGCCMRKVCWIFLLLLSINSNQARVQSTSPTFQLTHEIGRGHIQTMDWHPTNDILLVSTIRGAWFYDAMLRDLGHIEAARLATFSPDGELVAGVNAENQVILWNSETHAPVAALPRHDAFITQIEWNPRGELLASADSMGNLRIWDIQRQQALSKGLANDSVVAMSWSPDSLWLAMVMQDTSLYVYDLALQQQIFSAGPATCCRSSESLSLDVVWLDNQMLVRGVLDMQGQQFEQWNIETGELISESWPEVNMHLSPAQAFSPDGLLRAYSTMERVIIVNTRTNEILHEFEDIPWPLDHLAWNHDGTKLAGVGAHNELYMWDPSSGIQLALNLEHAQPQPFASATWQWQVGDPNVAMLPSWSFDSQLLAVPDQVTAVSIWDSIEWRQIAHLEGPRAPVVKIGWHPQNHWLFTLQNCAFSDDDYSIHIWDASTGSLLDTYSHEACPRSAAWHPTANILASVSWANAQVYIWDGNEQRLGQPLETVPYNPDTFYFNGVHWSPDGTHIVLSYPGGDANGTRLFDYPGMTQTSCNEDCHISHSGHSDMTGRGYWSADGSQWFHVYWNTEYAIDVYRDYIEGDPFSVHISILFNTHSNEPHSIELHGHSAAILDIAPEPSGTNLITLSEDNEARLWDVFTRETLLVLNDVNQVAWSPDGSLIGGFNVVDRRWHIFDAHSGDIVASLPIPSREAGFLVWSPDSQKIAQVVEGVVFIWER